MDNKKYDQKPGILQDLLKGILSAVNPQKPLVDPQPQTQPQVVGPATSQPNQVQSGSSNTSSDWQTFLDKELLPLTRKEGIPDALAASQAAGEGGRNPNQKSHFGLKPGGNLKQFKDLQSEVKMYAETVKNLAGGISPKDTAETILKRMQSGKTRYEASSPNPQDYVKMITNTPEYRKYENQ